MKNRTAAIAHTPATGNRLNKALQLAGHWDGICRVDPEPENDATPPTPSDTESKTDDGDVPLGPRGEKALQEWKKQAKALKAQVKALENKYGTIDPTEYESLLEFKTQQEQAEAERKRQELESKQQYDAARQSLIEEHKAKIAALETDKTTALQQAQSERDAIAQQYEDLLISTQLTQAFVAANGDPSKLEVLNIPAIRGKLRVTEGAVKIVGDDGEPTDQDVADWMTEKIKPQFLYLFKPEGTASGGGTTPGASRGGAVKTGQISTADFMKMKPIDIARSAGRQ